MTLQFPASDGMGAIAKLGTTWHTISGTGKNPCLAMCSALVRYAHGLQHSKSLEAQLQESVEASPKMR